MHSDLIEKLNMYFGFTSFRPGQVEAIQSLLNGRHTVTVMPTGSGKSLIFQLAAMYLPGITLVISPLIALMKDQVDSLEKHGIPATFINSSLSTREIEFRYRGISEKKFRIVYVAPERLRNSRFLEVINQAKISLLAVDEAHCISEWGHDFRPDYLHIAKFRELIGNPTTVALTATATAQVQSDISKLLHLEKPTLIVNGFNRPNLVFMVRPALDPAHRLAVLREAVKSQASGATIIYAGTRRDSEEVAEFLRTEMGINAHHYHAGLDYDVRTDIQNDFIRKKISVIVATNAFGMGIDRSDVRQVIHYSMPGSLEAYYQEAGRAGRDGMPAKALLIYSNKDRALQEFFIRNSEITKNELLKLYNALNKHANQELTVSGESLSILTGLNDVKIKVGLATLEQVGIVERFGDEGSQMIIKKHAWQAEKIEAAGLRIKNQQEIKNQQLQSMIHYAESDQCRRNIILKYFGDNSCVLAEVCCDNCIGRKAIQKTRSQNNPKPSVELVDSSLLILETIQQLKYGVGVVKIAQILQGSKNKELLTARLDKLPHYGKLSGLSTNAIRSMVEQLIKEGYIKVTGGQYPVLSLTHTGMKTLQERAAIPLKTNNLANVQKTPRQNTTEMINNTVEQTYQYYLSGHRVAEIARLRELSVGTIYSHLLILIKNGKVDIEKIIPQKHIQSIEKVIAEIGQVDRLTPLKELLPDEIGYEMIRCVVENWKMKQGHESTVMLHNPINNQSNNAVKKDRKIIDNAGNDKNEDHKSDDSIRNFLNRDHPRQLAGLWDCGWALGFHSRYQGDDWSRSGVGELLFRLKYQEDFSVMQPILQKIMSLIQEHPEIGQVDALLPVPSSLQRERDPVSSLARELAQQLKIRYWPVLKKSRETAQQKQFQTLAQKKNNVAGAFQLTSSVRGKKLLVLDDLFDSGATVEEITKLLKQAGADKVNILTITRTIHSER